MRCFLLKTAGVSESFTRGLVNRRLTARPSTTINDLPKQMNCENLQLNISIYFDDALTDKEKALVDRHLDRCPACRQSLAEFKMIRQDLRSMSGSTLAGPALSSIRARVADEIIDRQTRVTFADSIRAWAAAYLMPSAVGTFATFLIGMMFLWTLLSVSTPDDTAGVYEKPRRTTVLLAKNTPPGPDEFEINPADYANARLSVSGESPSLNPRGALVALTRSFMRGEMKDDEVVVVADVFGDGLARIAEVVEPSADRHAVRELEKALKSNPDYAPPFLPANLDHRSDSVVRVVLKFQTVNVDTEKPSN